MSEGIRHCSDSVVIVEYAMDNASVLATPSRLPGTIILRRDDVRKSLRMTECISAVERAFSQHARGHTIAPAVLGAHVDGGGFHIKTAGMFDAVGGRPVFVAKVN